MTQKPMQTSIRNMSPAISLMCIRSYQEIWAQNRAGSSFIVAIDQQPARSNECQLTLIISIVLLGLNGVSWLGLAQGAFGVFTQSRVFLWDGCYFLYKGQKNVLLCCCTSCVTAGHTAPGSCTLTRLQLSDASQDSPEVPVGVCVREFNKLVLKNISCLLPVYNIQSVLWLVGIGPAL